MIGQYALSLGLMALSGWMIDRHLRKWADRRAEGRGDEQCYRHCRAQHCRRMIASSFIGVAGALIAIGPIVPRRPLEMTVYMAALVFCCLVMLLCAVLDAYAGVRFYRRVKLEQRLKQAQLALEIELKNATERKAAPAED